MSKVAGDSYLGAIKDSLNSPNMILDLRIPQNQKYQQVVLDEAIARFLAGEIDEKQPSRRSSNGWNDLNDQIGIDTSSSSTRARSAFSAKSTTRRAPGATAGAPGTLISAFVGRASAPATRAADFDRMADLAQASNPRPLRARAATNGSTASPAASWCCRRSSILLAFAIFPLIISVYLSLSRFRAGRRQLQADLHRLVQLQAAPLRRAAISFPRHAQAARAARMARCFAVFAALVLYWLVPLCRDRLLGRSASSAG